MHYETYIFDLYGTLVDIHTDETLPELWEKLSLFFGYYGAFYQPEELQTSFQQVVESMESGQARLRTDSHEAFPEIQIENVFQQLFVQKNIQASEELSTHTAQFFRVLSTEYVRLYDGVAPMLQSLKDDGKRVYLLSNAQRVFTEYEVRALGIFPYFDGIFLSSDHGCKKPDLLFFTKLLDTFHIPRETAVMIGNDGICDIQGAKNAGLSTIYIRSNISPEESIPDADHVLSSPDMEELTNILLHSHL